jgi:hypothetical protein
MLLVLLTISAVGMSRNSLREVIITGTQRQGVEVRNVADSGVEWSIHWLNEPNRNGRGPDPGAKALIGVFNELTSSADLLGETRTVSAVSGSPMTSAVSGGTRSYTIQVIRMGELEMPMVSQAPGVVIQNPLLWSLRSDATLDYSGMTFQHSRESWVAAPPPGAVGNN